jgi:hypothetical protein
VYRVEIAEGDRLRRQGESNMTTFMRIVAAGAIAGLTAAGAGLAQDGGPPGGEAQAERDAMPDTPGTGAFPAR